MDTGVRGASGPSGASGVLNGFENKQGCSNDTLVIDTTEF